MVILKFELLDCLKIAVNFLNTKFSLWSSFSVNPDINDNSTFANVACPPLFPPKHGYLECSRPQSTNIESTDHIINRPGSQCTLRCPNGYRETGKFDKICNVNGQWFGEETGACIGILLGTMPFSRLTFVRILWIFSEYPAPVLICPPDVIVETPPNESTVKLLMAIPKSDVNWERDISVTPSWAKNELLDLGVGTQRIVYHATHPASKLTTNCSILLNILG